MSGESANFEFLRSHDVQLVRLAALAERYFQDDPNTCLIKLRQFAELLAQLTAAKTGQFVATEEAQADLLKRLKFHRTFGGDTRFRAGAFVPPPNPTDLSTTSDRWLSINKNYPSG